jgi:hypothetical protein
MVGYGFSEGRLCGDARFEGKTIGLSCEDKIDVSPDDTGWPLWYDVGEVKEWEIRLVDSVSN